MMQHLQSQGTVLIFTTWEECYWHLQIQVTHAAKYSTIFRTAIYNKELNDPKMARVEKLWYRW